MYEKQQYLDAAKLRENDAEDLPWGREGRHVPIADGRYLEIPMAKLVPFCFRLIWAQEMFTVKMYLLRIKRKLHVLVELCLSILKYHVSANKWPAAIPKYE